MTSQSGSSVSLASGGTWMTAINEEGTQDEYSDSEDASAASSDTQPIRWIRDPSTVFRGEETRSLREPSIHDYPSDSWEFLPIPPDHPSDQAPSSWRASPPPTAYTTTRWRPSRSASPASLERQPYPFRVVVVDVDHQTGEGAGPAAESTVEGASAPGVDRGVAFRGRPAARNPLRSEVHKPLPSDSCLPPPPPSRWSRRTSTVGDSNVHVLPTRPVVGKSAAKLQSNASNLKSTAPAHEASKPLPNTDDDETLPGANTMSDIWPLYLEHAIAEDKEAVKAWNSDLDSILIFAALFSAVLTTFIIESYSNLQADPTSEVLQAILLELQMARNASAVREQPAWKFQVAASAVRVNVYWFSSLILSLATALITILAKQWVNYLLAGLSPIPASRARHRQYRMDGAHRWHLPSVLLFLPILFHVALLFFFAGLVDFVWDVNESVALVAATLVCITSVVYVVANLLAYVYPDCPFKTSVSVFFSVAINLLIIAYRGVWLATSETGRTLVRLWGTVVLAFRSWYRRGRSRESSVEDGEFRLSRVGTIVASETRNYEPLRIASLRSQDEQFIEEHKTAMDARILLWLMRNADRLHEVQKLSHALINFPHLVAHRRLFVQQGAVAFLERLLQSSATSAYSKLTKENREAVTSVMHALAVLESEVELAGFQGPTTVGDEEDRTSKSSPASAPYLMIAPTINPPESSLSPTTIPVIVSLLNEAQNLPLTLVASALRISVRIPDSPMRGRVQSIKALVHEFLTRVAQYQPSPGVHLDIGHAVNTIVYLALHDTSYPNRYGFMVPPIDDTRYWLDYLSKLNMRPCITASARHQISWAICALAPSLLDPPIAMVVKPRIPRLGQVHPYAVRLTALVSFDTDPDVLCAALVALEGMLWAGAREERGSVTHVARLLTPIHIAFISQVQRRLKDNLVQASEVAKITPSIIRIAVYLAIFHATTTDEAKIALLRNVFWILAHLVETSQQNPSSLYMNMYAARKSRASRATTAVARHQGIEVRRWVYRAASRIMTLHLNLGGTNHSKVPLRIDPLELVFPDNSSSAVAAAMTLTLQSICGRKTMPATQGGSIDPLMLESFSAVLKDVFLRAMPPTSADLPPAESQDGAEWDWQATRIVAHLAGRGGLSALLASSVQGGVLSTALRTIRAVLYADTGTGRPPPRIPRHDADHPASMLATAFRKQYPSFCQMLATQVQEEHLQETEGEAAGDALVDFIRLSGNLAFYSAESNPDSPVDTTVIAHLLPFLSTLTAEADPRRASLAARRHAWGAIGSIVTLYTLSEQDLRGDPEPERRFRFDTFEPSEIAMGLMRALLLSSIETTFSLEPHCDLCQLSMTENVRLLLRCSGESVGAAKVRMALRETATAALRAVAALWKTEDAEVVEVRECLRRHGLSARLQPLVEAEVGETKQLADEIMKEVFDAERDTPPDSPETPR